MPTLADIDRWNPAQIGQVFRICSEQSQDCDTLSVKLASPALFQSWGGAAADAAENSADGIRRDLDTHGKQLAEIAKAAKNAEQDVISVKRRLMSIRADVEDNGFAIDIGDTVFHPNPPALNSPRIQHLFYGTRRRLQEAVDSLKLAAEQVDLNLAAAINVADGDLPASSAGSDSSSLADRRKNAEDAFHATYGRAPSTDEDWKIAAVLDPHSYDPKNKGVEPKISVAKINSVEGQGLIRMGAFIPSEHAYNPGADDLGDNRDFDVNFDPESTRFATYIDYENGYIVARQNPSVSIDGDVKVAAPKVSAAQTGDGTVFLTYTAANPLAPGGSTGAGMTAHTVNGDVVISPSAGGPLFGGNMTNYPKMEIYNDMPDGQTRTVYQYTPWETGSTGALVQLPFHHDGGDASLVTPFKYSEPHVGPPGTYRPHEETTTKLGSADDPPKIRIATPSR